MSEAKVKETIPLPIAIGIVVVSSLLIPIATGIANFPLWACFIVWAEYFALGAKPDAIPFIIIPYSIGATITWLSALTWEFLATAGLDVMLASALSLFVWMSLVGYLAVTVPICQKGSLPLFNGVSMYLAIYFTASVPEALLTMSGLATAALAITVATVFVGVFFGWINVVITFPKEVE
ncbi:MAG: DUF1097 family protein [Candidatus Asgardarchaeia archaeon]